MVLRKMMELSTSAREIATAWLLIGAIFFAMRSCEYLKTAPEESKRTKIIRIGNIVFKKDNRVLSHADSDLHSANLVRIRFVFQKNNRRDVQIHMFRSGDDLLCPVLAWATTVKRVRKIPGSDNESEVCLFEDSRKKKTLIHSSHVRSRLRAIVSVLGQQALGFDKEDIGLHSIRSGGAMAMFLAGTSVIIIQRVGRWSSEAFLEYIRDQVESFTLNVSRDMLKFEEFLNLNTNNQDSYQQTEDMNLEDGTLENENGPVDVPFRVRFNSLSLNNEM